MLISWKLVRLRVKCTKIFNRKFIWTQKKIWTLKLSVRKSKIWNEMLLKNPNRVRPEQVRRGRLRRVKNPNRVHPERVQRGRLRRVSETKRKWRLKKIAFFSQKSKKIENGLDVGPKKKSKKLRMDKYDVRLKENLILVQKNIFVSWKTQKNRFFFSSSFEFSSSDKEIEEKVKKIGCWKKEEAMLERWWKSQKNWMLKKRRSDAEAMVALKFFDRCWKMKQPEWILKKVTKWNWSLVSEG